MCFLSHWHDFGFLDLKINFTWGGLYVSTGWAFWGGFEHSGRFEPIEISPHLMLCMYVHWHDGVQVVPGIQCMTASGAQFEDGQTDDFDVVILATGYRSNVPKWLKVSILFDTSPLILFQASSLHWNHWVSYLDMVSRGRSRSKVWMRNMGKAIEFERQE